MLDSPIFFSGHSKIFKYFLTSCATILRRIGAAAWFESSSFKARRTVNRPDRGSRRKNSPAPLYRVSSLYLLQLVSSSDVKVFHLMGRPGPASPSFATTERTKSPGREVWGIRVIGGAEMKTGGVSAMLVTATTNSIVATLRESTAPSVQAF